jgi:endonuclease YncB( thermonuclease family)
MICTSSAAQITPREVRGRVVKVSDGDTVTLLGADNTRIKIRLAGIDAPESRMPYGHAAQAYLACLVLNKEVVAMVHKQDRYGRTVATLWIASKDLNLTMVQAGMAWHYILYAHEQTKATATAYAQAESFARSQRYGLWQDKHPRQPWIWRKE